jgi:diguanylate cyclase (GGDEF)-like protein
VLPGLVALVSLVLATLVLAPLSPFAAARTSWTASVVFAIGTVLLSRSTAKRLEAGNPARRFWWAMGASGFAAAVGYLFQLGIVGDPSDLSVRPINLALVGVGTLVVVVVMLTYPLRIRSRRERACFWLDMATVMVGAGAFGWYVADPSGDAQSVVLTVLTGPVVMLVAVFAVAKLLVAGQPPFSLWAGVIGAGAPVMGVLLVGVGPVLLEHGYFNWFFAISALGDAALMLACAVQRAQIVADPRVLERRRRRPYSILPYVAVAGTFALLAVAFRASGHDGRTWAVMGGAVFCTGLVVVRQLASFAENAHLLGELQATLDERNELASRLHDMAFSDGLTGLANRSLFHDRLSSAMARSARDGSEVVVLLLDLDDFKPINDNYGHAAGDAVLRAVSERLRECVRTCDTVARLGGDEFAVILHEPSAESVSVIAERIVTAVGQPCWFDDVSLTIGVSIGIATSQPGEHDTDRLLGLADAAMYQAKADGKNSYRAYDMPRPDERLPV